MAAGKQLSDNNPSGWQIGQTSSDPGGFWGREPVSRYATSITEPSSAAAVSVTGTTNYGFATSTQANAIAVGLARVIQALAGYGLITST